MGNVVGLKGPDYLTDVAKTLRAIANDIESGQVAKPDVVVLVAITEGEPISLYSSGHKADDYGTIAALEIGKQFAISMNLERSFEG